MTSTNASATSAATIDPLSGRVASRTDANGATRSYVYDEIGRNTEISKMMSGGAAPVPLITIEYNANDAGYAHAIARHVDAFDGLGIGEGVLKERPAGDGVRGHHLAVRTPVIEHAIHLQ